MPYGDVVPVAFQRLSSFATHSFRVTNPWWRPYRFFRLGGDEIREFPRSAFCELSLEGKTVDCLIPEAGSPAAFEAVLLLAATKGATTRDAKYLTPFRALESLAVHPAVEMRAIRHSLAHSTVRLQDVRIRDALKEMFGGPSINFRVHSHKREFYRCLGELLVLLDTALADTLVKQRRHWVQIDRRSLLAPFEEAELGLARI